MESGTRHALTLDAPEADRELGPYYDDGDMGIFVVCRESGAGASGGPQDHDTGAAARTRSTQRRHASLRPPTWRR